MGIARRFSLLVIVFGAVSIMAQALLFRELLAMCLGNELSAGLIFCGWLSGVGAGSWVGGVVAGRRRIGGWHVAGALVAFAVVLPLAVVFARTLRTVAGFSQGELLPFGALCWMVMVVSAPVSGLAGVVFSWLCSFAADADNVSGGDSDGGCSAAAAAPARVYALDAAGAAAGSLLYSLFLVIVFAPVTLAGLGAVAMCGAAAVWERRGGAPRAFAVCACGAAVLFVARGAGPLDSFSRRVQWRGQRVDVSVESPYANLTAVVDRGQASIFANGRYAGSAPESPGAEFVTHATLSMVGSPKDVLIIGGGPAAAREALKHGVKKVTVVELDPVMMGLRERYLSAAGLREFHGPGVEAELTDARAFVSGGGAKYDAIIMQAGEPDTLLVNRYYTVEFFRAARRRLKAGGIFAAQVSFQENFMTAGQADLLGTHVRTMRLAFGRALPVFGGHGVLLVARNGAAVEYDGASALRNYLGRGVSSERFGPESLMEALDRGRAEQALQQSEVTGPELGPYFAAADRVGFALDRLAGREGARVNRDFSPAGAYSQLRVSSEYYPGAARAVFAAAGARGVAGLWLCFAAAACAFAFALDRRSRGAGVAGVAPVVAAAGFSGLCAEVAAVFVFQSLNGNVYYFIGAILGSFMAGGALGGRFAGAAIRRGREREGLRRGAAALACLCAASGFGLTALLGGGGGGLATAVVLGGVFAFGLLAGEIFPLAAAVCGAGRAGGLYAADHAGAALGALLAGVFIIPAAGAAGAMYVCAATVLLCAAPAFARAARV